MKKWTGERLETFILSRDTIDHLNRYAYVINYITGKTVLDIACGEGYGSHLMSSKATKVIGVDIDAQTIVEAKNKYKRDNLTFLNGSTENIPLEDNSVDVVVSFETIEHHDKHIEMINEIKRVLKKDGILIISTPDKHYYSDVRGFKNEFHIKELYRNEFEKLIKDNFSITAMMNQVYINGSSFICSDEIFQSLSIYDGSFEEIYPNEKTPMYVLAIASDFKFHLENFVVFNGEHILNKNGVEFYKKLCQSSNSFKLGHAILYPFKRIKKVLNQKN